MTTTTTTPALRTRRHDDSHGEVLYTSASIDLTFAGEQLVVTECHFVERNGMAGRTLYSTAGVAEPVDTLSELLGKVLELRELVTPVRYCYHPRSCSDCDREGRYCGAHVVGTAEHKRCTGRNG